MISIDATTRLRQDSHSDWIQGYNEYGPNSALIYQMPCDFAAKCKMVSLQIRKVNIIN